MQRALTSRSSALARSSKLRSVTSVGLGQQLRFAHKVRGAREEAGKEFVVAGRRADSFAGAQVRC